MSTKEEGAALFPSLMGKCQWSRSQRQRSQTTRESQWWRPVAVAASAAAAVSRRLWRQSGGGGGYGQKREPGVISSSIRQ